jgi:hypothetical protein
MREGYDGDASIAVEKSAGDDAHRPRFTLGAASAPRG